MANEKVLPLEQIVAASTPTDSARIVIHDFAGSANYIDLATLKRLVRESIQIGGRNLIKNSGETVSNGAYPVLSRTLTAPIGAGESGCITIWGEIDEARNWALYANGDKIMVCKLNKVAEGKWQAIFTNGSSPIDRAFIFAMPNTGSISTITRIKLERGNIPTDWTPAPEDWGG